jgi:hypothetical protein
LKNKANQCRALYALNTCLALTAETEPAIITTKEADKNNISNIFMARFF